MNWDDLIASALIGSARRPLKLAPDASALGALSSKLTELSPEAQLLSAAALSSLYRKAGRTALSLGPSELQAAPPNSSAECSFFLSQIFVQICERSEYASLIPEFCAGLKQRNLVLHRSILVRALKAIRLHNGEKRQALIEVLGERGTWLMQYAEHMNKFQPLEEIDLDNEALVQNYWETSTHNQRLTLLARLREHDPARARELLRSNWQQETAQNRAELLSKLQIGLSMNDEPLLEETLENRSQTVRLQAADLLARLPASRLSQRMRVRAEHYIKLKAQPRMGLKSKIAKLFGEQEVVPAFQIELPPEHDGELWRDGIDGKQHVSDLGIRAGILMQLIAATPLDYWAESGFDQSSLITAAQHDEWAKAIIAGWVLATLRQQNLDWAIALSKQPLAVLQHASHGSLEQLLDMLPREQQEALATTIFLQVKEDKKLRNVLLHIMSAMKRPWSAALTDGVFEHLHEVITNNEHNNTLFNPHNLDWLAAVDMERAHYWLPQLLELAKQKQAFMLNVIEKYVRFYEFRNRMLKELSR